MKYPKSVTQLIEQFRKLPGVGSKSAERFALQIITSFSKEDVSELATTLIEVKDVIKGCSVCGTLTDEDVCMICKDKKRDQSKILIVEQPKDVITLESSNTYNGLYHVLGGVLNPTAGIGPEELKLKELLERLKNDEVKEVIIATNLNVKGEITANYIYKLLEQTDLLVTRIAHGLPAGGHLEFADELTLSKALEGRRKF